VQANLPPVATSIKQQRCVGSTFTRRSDNFISTKVTAQNIEARQRQFLYLIRENLMTL
jgi:hypothetical protein